MKGFEGNFHGHSTPIGRMSWRMGHDMGQLDARHVNEPWAGFVAQGKRNIRKTQSNLRGMNPGSDSDLAARLRAMNPCYDGASNAGPSRRSSSTHLGHADILNNQRPPIICL